VVTAEDVADTRAGGGWRARGGEEDGGRGEGGGARSWQGNFGSAFAGLPHRRRDLAAIQHFRDNERMAQTTRQLEARLERVEKELAALQAKLAGKPAKPWYEEIVGCFKGDEAFAEISRLGRLIRQGKIKR